MNRLAKTLYRALVAILAIHAVFLPVPALAEEGSRITMAVVRDGPADGPDVVDGIAGELARFCGVAPSTMSRHLARLIDTGLLVAEPAGRYRYYRIANAEVAALLEQIDAIDLPEVAPPKRPDPGTELSWARSCYDHIAGDLGFSPAFAALLPAPIGTRFSLPVAQPRPDGSVDAVTVILEVVGKESLELDSGLACDCWVLEQTDQAGSVTRYWVSRDAPFVFRRHRDIGGPRDTVTAALSLRWF